ncbi:hypothetical protein SPBR_01827 [Sporothrix brasiliensis 5110]|uniref:Uncharacterized protein n=1 Tax=Sporothrix brasiliensis 5110 TaxID=1398154 RepID=A0A0C2J2Q6_9PEZI|nr:uncharacterized protein SPBR_01827 [Sporothrix brasiliensis 5110]KIH91372.1 hypothetical protein SPBR_01827 [Sporothrix brasiliensis 5110]
MPQDPDLYGQRTAKKKKTELGLSNTLDFASQLQSLITAKPKAKGSNSATSRSGTASGEKRRNLPLFPSPSKRSRTDSGVDDDHKTKDKSKSKSKTAPWNKRPPPGAVDAELDDAERERIRRNMAAKAKRYAQMQRGDYLPREGEVASLVDFDRKWAEKRRRDSHSDGSDSSDNGDSSEDEDDANGNKDSGDTTMVEYVDEFGRTRTVSKARRERDLRRQERARRAAQDLADMRARPAPPPDTSRLIFGDVIQTEAIEAAADQLPPRPLRADEEDAPAETHYRPQDDVRTRGAAFYAFATDDEKKRAEQMQALADERAKTEAARAERSAQLEARKQEMAARRAALAERKAKKQADSFLDGLGMDLFAGRRNGGGGEGDENEKPS